MAEPVIVTVHYTPPGAPDSDRLHLELHAEPGARLTVHLGALRPPPKPTETPAVPSQAQEPQGPSLRSTVHRLHALGITDTDTAQRQAAAALGRAVSPGSVARYLREASAAQSPQLPPARDWHLPSLPADCAPGRAPQLLTDTQAHARIRYGISQGWTQRRIGEFAGRSATVVNRVSKKK